MKSVAVPYTASMGVGVNSVPQDTSRLGSLIPPAILVLLVLGGCVITAFVLEGNARQQFLAESGPVETGSALSYVAITVLLCGFSFWRVDRRFTLQTAAISALLLARELDCHNRFTTEGVFRSSFYFRNNASISEKIIVSIIMIGIIVLLVDYARKYTGRYIRGALSLTPWILCVGAGFVMIVLGKAMDSSTWAFEAVGVEQQLSISLINILEESLEFAGAVALLCASVLFIRSALRERSPRAKPLNS
ncbi:MAG: hypothetical protein F6K11_33830 [Leptolyngbya sp. SIO3F4]|nr:hypothetical protein [Leptolyngbya sp. SIO3F4]